MTAIVGNEDPMCPNEDLLAKLNALPLDPSCLGKIFETPGTPRDEYTGIMELLQESVEHDLIINSKKWKEALVHQRGRGDPIPKLSPDSNPWVEHYHLIRGQVLEAVVIKLIEEFIRRILGRILGGIITIKPYSIPLLRFDNDGCVPDLVLKITRGNKGNKELWVFEIKSLPRVFDANTANTKAKISLAHKQVTKCKHMIEKIIEGRGQPIPKIHTCLLMLNHNRDGLYDFNYSIQ